MLLVVWQGLMVASGVAEGASEIWDGLVVPVGSSTVGETTGVIAVGVAVGDSVTVTVGISVTAEVIVGSTVSVIDGQGVGVGVGVVPDPGRLPPFPPNNPINCLRSSKSCMKN